MHTVLSARQVVEFFHLVFLRALAAKGEGKSLIALKGGCNLRFYFGSIRYSEDLDLDVTVIGKDTLKNKVERTLKSPSVTAPLRTLGVEIVEVSAPKQTDTTQRWKAGLRAPWLGVQLRTKIEFSRRPTRRAMDGNTAFEAAGATVIGRYGLTPFAARHYTTHAAINQKVAALAGRSEPQARDLFDLNLLLARADAARVALDEEQKAVLSRAIDHAMSVSFDDYASNVFAYLDPAQAEIFEDRAAWEVMQGAVVSRLEALR